MASSIGSSERRTCWGSSPHDAENDKGDRAAGAARLVVTLFDQAFVVDRPRSRIVEKLRGQFHTVALAGRVLVLHRRPLGDAGELRFFR